MIDFVEHTYQENLDSSYPIVLVADIGGTNSNFGIGQFYNGKAHIVRSLHAKTAIVNDFTTLVVDLLTYIQDKYAWMPEKACFAIAAAVAPNARRVKLTNAPVTIDIDLLYAHTQLKHITLVNDFQVISYGIDSIAPTDIVCVQKGAGVEYGNRALLGAGTGLGASVVHWVASLQRYVAVASEAGHMDFAPQTAFDIAFAAYLRKQYATHNPVSWEQVLSGKAIGMLYAFLATQNLYQDEGSLSHDSPHPDEIFARRLHDKRAYDTCIIYAHYYGQCARNWALATVALGGLYLVGGIAAHNAPLFAQSDFLDPFLASYKHQDLLQAVPLWVITNYAVSLYGALAYLYVECA